MILAIDTATPFLALGLLGENVERERTLDVGRGHAEHLAAAVEELLWEHEQPKLVVVGLGPGSYTGLRVGASYALGLGRAWQVPVVGVPTLEAIAARQEGLVAASLDARRGSLYGGIYEVREGIVTQVHLPPQKLEREAFTIQVEGITWLDNEVPSGLALARQGATHGGEKWRPEYL